MICLVALGADAAFAEGDELDRFQLDELMRPLVVTAGSGTLDSLARAPASVFTVSREEIARHGWRSMAEILANVPGLYVIDDQVLPAVGVRGITGGLRSGSRVVKMMIDGTEVSFRPDLTGFLGPEYIPVEAIERVEVAKGPLSVWMVIETRRSRVMNGSCSCRGRVGQPVVAVDEVRAAVNEQWVRGWAVEGARGRVRRDKPAWRSR